MDAADVAAAIRFARDAGLDLTVRGGGHNFGGAAVGDGAVMLHLGDMNTVFVEIKAKFDPDNVFHHNANIRPEPVA